MVIEIEYNEESANLLPIPQKFIDLGVESFKKSIDSEIINSTTLTITNKLDIIIQS